MDGTTLSNQAESTLTGNWVIPDAGGEGTIQNTASGGGYLSVNANTNAGTSVDVEALDGDDDGQKWERSADISGFFTLKNTKT